MEFRPWLILNEANQHEAQALKMLGGDQSKLATLKSFAGEAKFLPVLALLHRQQPDPTQLSTDWEEYLALLKDKKMPALSTQGDRVVTPPANQTVDYLQWTEKLHALAGDRKLVQSRLEIDHSEHKPPIFRNDELEIYETDGPGDCIRYGKGYKFCISQPGNTMWKSYRDTGISTFYFVYDRKRPDTDPLHIVVVDMKRSGPVLTDANNNTGNIARFGKDAKAYLDHLHKRGVPQDLFRNKPKTEREIEEDRILGKQNPSLDWFKKLSPEQRSDYIGRGHELGDEQFDYIFDNGLDGLAKQYAELGMKLKGRQLERMLDSKFKGTYLHFRLIANQTKYNLAPEEYDAMSEKQKASLDPRSVFYIHAAAGREREAEKIVDDGGMTPDDAMDAALNADKWDLAKKMFEKGAWRGLSRLFILAAQRPDMEFLKRLVELGPTRDLIQDALERAAARGNPDAVEYLAANGAKDLGKALYLATGAKDLYTVKILVDLGAARDPKAVDEALINSIISGNLETFKYLMDQNPQSPGNALNYAIHRGGPEGLKFVKALVAKGVEIDRDALMKAANVNDHEMIKYLMQARPFSPEEIENNPGDRRTKELMRSLAVEK
jgi:hypothetical protein